MHTPRADIDVSGRRYEWTGKVPSLDPLNYRCAGNYQCAGMARLAEMPGRAYTLRCGGQRMGWGHLRTGPNHAKGKSCHG
jgi:hypothetical protein